MKRALIVLTSSLLLTGSAWAKHDGMGYGMMGAGLVATAWGSMHQQGNHMYGGFWPGALDETVARKAFDSMHAMQKAMFEMSLGARKRMDAVRTPPQREQLRREWAAH